MPRNVEIEIPVAEGWNLPPRVQLWQIAEQLVQDRAVFVPNDPLEIAMAGKEVKVAKGKQSNFDAMVLNAFGLSPTIGEVGIEVEVECNNKIHNIPRTSGWATKRDGSLRGFQSAEYVLISPVPRTMYMGYIDALLKHFEKNGMIIDVDSERTGIHIHINVQELTMMQIINLLCIYYILEEMIVSFCREDRIGNVFSLRASDAKDLIQFMKTNLLVPENWLWLGDDRIRYSSLNLTSLRKFGSVEFRSLETTLSREKIETWTEMHLLIKDAAKKFAHPKTIVEGFSAAGPKRFAKSILQDYFKVFENLPNLNTMLYHGVRNAQEIAYNTGE